MQHLLLTMELDLDVEGIERMLLDLTIIPGILLQADIIIYINKGTVSCARHTFYFKISLCMKL